MYVRAIQAHRRRDDFRRDAGPRRHASFTIERILHSIEDVHEILTSILKAGLTAERREGCGTRHTVFFTPVGPWSTEEEEYFDFTRLRKVQCKTGWKHSQNAVYWIHRGRAQEKGIAFWQTKSHATVTDSTVPLDCIERVITQHGEMTINQRSSTPRLATRIVLRRAWHEQQQDVSMERSRVKLLASQSPKEAHSTVQEELRETVDRTQSGAPSLHNDVKEESSFQSDLRVHGASQDDMYKDEERMTEMRHLVDRLQDGYRGVKSIIEYMKQEGVSEVFSKESKRKLKEMGNIELYELSETVRTTQCPTC